MLFLALICAGIAIVLSPERKEDTSALQWILFFLFGILAIGLILLAPPMEYDFWHE